MIEAVNQFQLDLALIEGSCHLPQLQCIHWRDDELWSAVHQNILWRSLKH